MYGACKNGLRLLGAFSFTEPLASFHQWGVCSCSFTYNVKWKCNLKTSIYTQHLALQLLSFVQDEFRGKEEKKELCFLIKWFPHAGQNLCRYLKLLTQFDGSKRMSCVSLSQLIGRNPSVLQADKETAPSFLDKKKEYKHVSGLRTEVFFHVNIVEKYLLQCISTVYMCACLKRPQSPDVSNPTTPKKQIFDVKHVSQSTHLSIHPLCSYWPANVARGRTRVSSGRRR